jgi:hypothetical protein
MMLIATRELPDEHVYQITFGLAQSPSAKIEVGIQALWCEQARAGQAYWVGCKIIDINRADTAQLQIWVDQATEVAN